MSQINLSGTFKTVQEPNKCPRCHHAISPIFLTYKVVNNFSTDVAFQCTYCKHIFITNYIDRNPGVSLPKEYKEINFEKEIEDISSNFIEIYNQSIEAETQNLSQLTGIGLRKSLEFLIKDFLVYKKPEDEENIKKTQLSRCINNYIDDVKLKQISERATWLGNDETHYVRKWEDKDIKDLKLLIQVTVNMIHNDLLTEKYLSDMVN